MSVVMKQPFPEIPSFQTPVLHRVYYNPLKVDFHTIHSWCAEYCKELSYSSPSWDGCYVEFEDDEDATFFALKWG